MRADSATWPGFAACRSPPRWRTNTAGATISIVDLTALARDINSACRLEGTFVLRSGQTSNEYFDKYLFESQPALLLRVAEAMVPLLPTDTQLLGGLELGGVPIVTMVSSLTGLPAIFVRKQAKTYGTCRLAEGAAVTGKRVTLIEDVITTGGAVRDATLALRAQGARVAVVVCAIDRSDTVGVRLVEVDISTRAALTREQLDAAAIRAGDTPWGDPVAGGTAPVVS